MDEMSHAERIKKAIDLKEPDRIPAFSPCSWGVNMAGDNINRMGKPEKDVYFPKYVHNPDIYADAWVKAVDRFGFDFVHVLVGSNVLALPMGCKEAEPPWGIPQVVGEAIEKVEDWKNLKFPNMDTDGKIPVQLSSIRLLDKELHERRGDDVFITGTVIAPLTLAGFLLGVEPLMFAMIEKPDETRELVEFCADAGIECAKAQIDAGADHIFTPDPTASGDLIPADFYEQLAFPAAKRQSEAIRKYKDKYAHHYHICGNTADRLETLAKVGMSVISLDNQVSLKDAKERIGGKVCLCGNVNPADTLFMGTPEKVEVESKQCIADAGPGGGFILWSGCDFPLDCPLENIERFYEMPGKYGKYPLQG